MFTQEELDEAVREAYEHAHNCCHYGPSDRSFPVGDDGIIDCTGLMLRALYSLHCVAGALNCDDIDKLMPRFGFVKSTDVNDVYRHHGFVQWVLREWRGTNHVHHTYYSLGGDGRTISKYDTGSEARLRTEQPFTGVPVDEWGGKYVFKHIWYLPDAVHTGDDESGTYLKVGD